MQWKKNPSIYQINTCVWLKQLSEQYGYSIDLTNVPDEALDELAGYHVDSIWMMGVWQRGDATRTSALRYIHEYRTALDDIEEMDVTGSAYAIHRYEVEPAFGGREGLSQLRWRLGERQMKLVLDFVPNHVATDHEWLTTHPEYFISGTKALVKREPGNFFSMENANGNTLIYAHGRDPYFPGWIDTAQFNAFSPAYRQAALDTLNDIASQCDGVRCDMAMCLMMTDVFSQTWGWRGVNPLLTEFWESIIPQVKQAQPDFIFIAEVYWHLEYEMMQQGFDLTYDKVMYDRLVKGDAGGMRVHLLAERGYLDSNVRFIENHDEPRAASAIGIARSKPSAALIATVPGALLLHEGQFVGRRIKLPVQICRQPVEELDMTLKDFYLTLLQERRMPIYQEGEWRQLSIFAKPGDQSAGNVVAYAWNTADDWRLIAVNFGEAPAHISLRFDEWYSRLHGQKWQAINIFDDELRLFDAHQDVSQFDLELGSYGYAIYALSPASAEQIAAEAALEPVHAS